MINYARHIPTRLRSINHTNLPAATTVGGWALDHWARLDRFLTLGTEGVTYHVGERPLTQENALHARACIAENGVRAVLRVVEVCESKRAVSNEPALFVLALCASAEDPATRAAAFEALPSVARTGTHLFHWLRYTTALRGWGRGMRAAVGNWYARKSPRELASQLLKHNAHDDGWSHRDALRLAHPTAPSFEHDLLFRYAVDGWAGVAKAGVVRSDIGARIEAVHAIREMTPDDAARVIRIYNLTRDMVPAALLKEPAVWEALLGHMSFSALVRNLGAMSKVGLLVPGSAASRTVVSRLNDRDALRRSRLQPLAILAALNTYASGKGERGRGRWMPVSEVVDALDAAFYASFENVPATGKRIMLALDVSGSMATPVHGMECLSCRGAAAAMALVTAATEPNHKLVAFTRGEYRSRYEGIGSGISPVAISSSQRLDEVVRTLGSLPYGGTDCALPMIEAAKHRWEVDAFVVFTDNETWAGDVHPAQALADYRDRMGIDARLIVVGMTSPGFSIADPTDSGMLDVVGFDTATPAVISSFVGSA